jgi:hypothetical protein
MDWQQPRRVVEDGWLVGAMGHGTASKGQAGAHNRSASPFKEKLGPSPRPRPPEPSSPCPQPLSSPCPPSATPVRVGMLEWLRVTILGLRA